MPDAAILSHQSTLEALIYFLWAMETKGFFQFEIIMNVLVIFFRFIWIPMLSFYGPYKYVYSHSAGIDFRRPILTSKVDSRTVKMKWIGL